jgi:hypothetical protein
VREPSRIELLKAENNGLLRVAQAGAKWGSYVLESSPDLLRWSRAAILTNGQAEIVPFSANSQQFFRALELD